MSVLLKAIYIFDFLTIKILITFFTEIEKKSLVLYKIMKTTDIQSLNKKNKARGIEYFTAKLYN